MIIKILCEIFIHVAASLLKLPNWKDCSLFALNEIIWLISFELIGILTKEIVFLLIKNRYVFVDDASAWIPIELSYNNTITFWK